MKGVTADQAYSLIKEVAPFFFTVVGSAVSLVFTLLAWGFQKVWASYNRKMAILAKTIDGLSGVLATSKEVHDREVRLLKESISALRTDVTLGLGAIKSEISSAGTRLDGATRSISGIEAVCKTQQEQLQKTSEGLALASGRLDAVFRYVDATVRATDIAATRRG